MLAEHAVEHRREEEQIPVAGETVFVHVDVDRDATHGGAAVLVVFPRFVDAEILRRQADAGDDPLDTFWRMRSHRA